jgi:hypothetical protein
MSRVYSNSRRLTYCRRRYRFKTPQPLFHERFHVMSLRMLERVSDAGLLPGKHRLTYSKLTHAHFHLTNALKMRVPLAAHVLSTTVAHLIRGTQEDQSLLAGSDHRNEPGYDAYGPLLEFVEIADAWFDVVNTNVPKGNFPIQESDLAADGSQLHTLLRTVDYFTTWRAKLRTSGLCAKEMECSFITREQWEDVQWNCLGMVSLCHYYLTGHPERRIVGRRLQTDVIEHHFANRRQQRGTNAKGQVAALNAADAAASACREVSFVSSKANCSKRKDHADRDPYGDPVHISVGGMEGRRKSRRRLDNHHLTLDAKVDPDWYRQAPTTDQPMT